MFTATEQAATCAHSPILSHSTSSPTCWLVKPQRRDYGTQLCMGSSRQAPAASWAPSLLLTRLSGASPPTPPPFSHCLPRKLSQNVLGTVSPHGRRNVQHTTCRCFASTIASINCPRPAAHFSFHLLFPHLNSEFLEANLSTTPQQGYILKSIRN